MKLRRRKLLGVGAAWLCGGPALHDVNAEAAPTDPAMQERIAGIDRLVQPLIDSETIAGLVIGLVDNDRTTMLSYGLISSSDQRNRPATPSTRSAPSRRCSPVRCFRT